MNTEWPRIRDLPEPEKEPFKKWLYGQTCPLVEGLPFEEQDFYYPWDYHTWRNRANKGFTLPI